MGDELFTLEDIYQNTECGDLPWRKLSPGFGQYESQTRVDWEKEKIGGRKDALEAVCTHLINPNFRDILVIQGTAGAGKSSFCLRFASELIIEHGLSPIFVRFCDLRLSRLTSSPIEEILSEAVRTGPEDEVPPISSVSLICDRLLREEATLYRGICRHVFVLDGWDEISLTGSLSYRQQLMSLMPRLRDFFINRPGLAVRLILTGRPSIEMGEAEILHGDSRVLSLLPLRPEQLEKMANTLISQSPHWELTEDSVNIAISEYSKWFVLRDKESAPARTKSLEIMGLPLLSLLTFRTIAGYSGTISELLQTPTALYKALADQTVEHYGNPENFVGPEGTARIAGDQLRLLLRKTAALISVLESETITYEELASRLREEKDKNLEKVVYDFSNARPLSNLVINFYFKGGQTDLGCEFLHKSFREYFFAEEIFSILKNFAIQNPTAPMLPTSEYWEDFPERSPQFELARCLAKLFCPQWQTPEERRNIFWLLQNSIREEPEQWLGLRDLLADVYGWWAEGIPLRMRPRWRYGRREMDPPLVDELMQWCLPFTREDSSPLRSTTVDGHLGEALLQLTALVHYELLEIVVHQLPPEKRIQHSYQSWDPNSKLCRFRPGGNARYLGNLLSRIDAVGFRPEGSALNAAFLAGIESTGEYLSHKTSFVVNFSEANLIRANLSRATLVGADLTNADLTEADLSGTELFGADLSSAYLASANLRRAGLKDATLIGADLSGADIGNADLGMANLTDANLLSANLSNAHLSGILFDGANLTNACLIGANLSGAQLIGANLSNADLRRSNVFGADFTGANLSGTNLTGTHIHFAKNIDRAFGRKRG